ncbi:MAG: hypothetical protein WCJ59_01505 [bacterium]
MSIKDFHKKIKPWAIKKQLNTRASFTKTTSFIESDLWKDIAIVAILVLVGLASYGLGRISIYEDKKPKVEVKDIICPISGQNVSISGSFIKGVKTSVSENTQNTQLGTTTIIASKNGTKYHYSWCPGAKQISEANKIWFNTIDEARTAGYTPASNCPNLK